MPVRFRGYDGRFLPAEDRLKKTVKTVEAFRRGRWVTLIDSGNVTQKDLAVVLNRKEFEEIPAAYEEIGKFTPRSKFQAWNIAEQIDKTKGVRRKLLRINLVIQDGKKKSMIRFYQKINKNQKSSARIYHRINEALGAEGLYTYKMIGGKAITNRKGKKVKIVGVSVEQVL